MNRAGRWGFLCLLAVVVASGAEPQVLAQRDLPQGMGVARRLAIPMDGGMRSLVAVTLVPGSFVMRLMDQSPTFPVGARTVAQSRTLVPGAVVALNGGYFEPSFQPSGLLRIAGRDLSPRADAGVLSGILALDDHGVPRLLERGAMLDGLPTAVQAGPFLIDPGGALGVRVRAAAANRSVIACDDHGRVLLLATGALTLHAVATLLHEQPQAFGLERVDRALNLDGGPSSGLSLAGDDPSWSVVERGPVRNVLVVTPAPP